MTKGFTPVNRLDVRFTEDANGVHNLYELADENLRLLNEGSLRGQELLRARGLRIIRDIEELYVPKGVSMRIRSYNWG